MKFSVGGPAVSSNVHSATVSRSAYHSRARSRIRSAMSPVPPATSMHRRGPRAPGLRRPTKSSFQSRCTPIDIASFMRSYFAATDENTPRTSSSFDAVGTVWKPKWVVEDEDEGSLAWSEAEAVVCC